MVDLTPNWIELALKAGEFLFDAQDPKTPVTLLIGAGGSRSSGAPGTEQVLGRCKEMNSDIFRTDTDVYERFSEVPVRDRDKLIRPLFEDVKPYVGYRCLAALASQRPICVVNLNWDGCVQEACDQIDVPCTSLDLDEVERCRESMEELHDRGSGVVCVHVHGFLDDDREETRGIRLAARDTASFEGDTRKLLVELLSYPTLVAGTSLVGPQDVHQMLDALAGDLQGVKTAPRAEGEEDEKKEPEPLWVFERGDPSRMPRFSSQAAAGLSKAVSLRNSFHYFVSNTDVDFDTLLTCFRSRQLGFEWEEVCEQAEILPELKKIVPPNPATVMPLLEGDRSLIVGAPGVGTTTLTFLVAWWRCLMSTSSQPRRIRSFRGIGPALEALKSEPEAFTGLAPVVIDEMLDDRAIDDGDEADAKERTRVRDQLAERLEGLDAPVLATASPDGVLDACGPSEQLSHAFANTVVWARSLWLSDNLRAWARARGGEDGRDREEAERICRGVRLGSITTPSQAIRCWNRQLPHEQGGQWRGQLRRHLGQVYPLEAGAPEALVLAMLRLQDFSTPRPAVSLDKQVGKEATARLIEDPWGFCIPIEVDKKMHVRLSSAAAVRVVDAWIADGLPSLRPKLKELGWRSWWTLDALTRWEDFQANMAERRIPAEDPDIELFGGEYFRRALQDRDQELALDALWALWEAKPDHWTAKDLALDLILEWDELSEQPRARDLRDRLLGADEQLGAYALFEAIMRVGRPLSLDLWSHVVARLEDLARESSSNCYARRQVALSLDALLWRPCPAGREQERKLLGDILAAAERDPPLQATIAAACAYHHHGAERLRDDGFKRELQLAVPANPDRECAEEMAWLVRWHFAHQSRCRALASRRTFLSTIDGWEKSAPRYLDRLERKDPLSPQQTAAIVRYIDALMSRPETADWALHLAMNIHTTTGSFDLHGDRIGRFREALEGRPLGEGVLTAALTYNPKGPVAELIRDLLTEGDKSALRDRIGDGVEVDGTKMLQPRFAMWEDPFAIRNRWRLTKKLPLKAGGPHELLEKVAAHLGTTVERGFLTRQQAEHAFSTLWRGDLRFAESYRRRSLDISEEDEIIQLLQVIATGNGDGA